MLGSMEYVRRNISSTTIILYCSYIVILSSQRVSDSISEGLKFYKIFWRHGPRQPGMLVLCTQCVYIFHVPKALASKVV